jgi:hypothetical protein
MTYQILMSASFPNSDSSLYVMNVTQIHGQPDPTDFHIFYRINWIARELRVSRLSYGPKEVTS